MRSHSLATLVFFVCLLSVAAASADQIPDLVTIYLFDGVGEDFRIDRTGSASYGGMNAVWTVGDFSAEATFAGAFDSPGNQDVFYVEWLVTLDTMPLSVEIESSTAGIYSIYPIFQRAEDPEPVATMVQETVSGSTYFGNYFPECDKISFAVYLDESNTDYDVTITMNWGPGVANDVGTWGGIKSLYR